MKESRETFDREDFKQGIKKKKGGKVKRRGSVIDNYDDSKGVERSNTVKLADIAKYRQPQ
jgi:hypothetical protein